MTQSWPSPKRMAPISTLKINENMHFQATVTCLSQIKTINVIRDKLSPTQMDMFKESCFGYLLHMPHLKFCGNIVHSLLLREIEGPCSMDEGMKFLVGGHVIQFSKRDFALITGLSFRKRPGLEKDPLFWSNRLRHKYFGGSKSISMHTLEEVFMECQHEEDTVKLALVYLLEFLLLGKDKKTYIDLRFLQIVDDLEEFNKYPWGLVSYERTVTSLSIALKRRAEKFKEKLRTNPNHRNETYSLMGFPFAFQVWAYENIPELGEQFAKRTDNVNCLPILQWTCETAPTYTSLQTTVFNCNKLTVLSPLPLSYRKQPNYCIEEESADHQMEEAEDSSDYEEEDLNKKPAKRAKTEGKQDSSREIKQLREELKEMRELLRKREVEIIELKGELAAQRQTLYSHVLESRTEFRKLRMAKNGGRG